MTETTQLSDGGSSAASPDISSSGGDLVGVVFEQDVSGADETEIVLVQLDPTSAEPTSSVTVSTDGTNSSSPSVEINDSGEAAVVFLQLESTGTTAANSKRSAAVVGRVFDPSLDPKTDVFTISDDKSPPRDRPTVSTNSRGDCFVAWPGEGEGNLQGASTVRGAALTDCTQKGRRNDRCHRFHGYGSAGRRTRKSG